MENSLLNQWKLKQNSKTKEKEYTRILLEKFKRDAINFGSNGEKFS